jgi:hypothetical protein
LIWLICNHVLTASTSLSWSTRLDMFDL